MEHFNVETIIGIGISIGLNVLLYASGACLISRLVKVTQRRRRSCAASYGRRECQIMRKKWIYACAAAGILAPAAALLDLNLLGNSVFTNDWVTLSLWPSSIMLMGTEGFNIEVIIALALSIGINMLLYAGVGFLIAKLIGFALRLRTGTGDRHP